MKMPFKCVPTLALAALAVAASAPNPVHAEDLLVIYQQAQGADPVLTQAKAQNRIAEEDVDIARAQLLPQLSASYSYSRSQSTRGGTQVVNMGNGNYQVFPTADVTTDSFGTTLRATLNQTILDFSKFATLDANQALAQAQDKALDAVLEQQIVRVSKAYFQVLTAQDQLNFAKAQERALSKQLDQAQARYEAGLSAILDVNEAKANHDVAAANVIAASNTVDDARAVLRQITGQSFGTLQVLRDDLPLIPPEPASQEAWVDKALAQNPEVLAQRYRLEAAEEQIDAARGNHLPTLGASLSYTRSPGWNDLDPALYGGPMHTNSHSEDTAIGLTLSIPIFNGGAIHSRVQQSVYRRDIARATLEQNRRQAVHDTRSAYRAVVAGISEIKARKQALLSAQSALEATQAGYKVGTRTIIDVLNVQQQLFQARSAYSRARHEFIIDKLLLKESAGVIDFGDLKAVNALLVPAEQQQPGLLQQQGTGNSGSAQS